jgi:acetyl esterase/lipase
MEKALQTGLPENLRQLLARSNELIRLQREQGREYTPIGAREALDLMTRRFVTQAPEIPFIQDALVQDSDASDYPVPVRIYDPAPEHTLPVLVFAHGGGHMAGSVSVYDPIARKLAAASQRIVISVEYRLSPECPYPAGLNDLEQVIRFAYPTLDGLGINHQRKMAIAGDSGGAAISASAVHRLADEEGVELDRQVLIYPSLDYTMHSESVKTLGCGYLLERDRMAWYFDQYLQNNEDRREVSPLFMHLPKRYPETLLVTAGFCPLRDEGIAYAKRLQGAGIPVEHLHRPDMIHAFLNLEDLVKDACAGVYRSMGEFLLTA